MALLIYFLFYFSLAFMWRSFVVYKRTGQNPFVLPVNDDAYGYVGRAFKLVTAVVAIIVVLNALISETSQWLGTFTLLQTKSLQIIGWILLLTSLGWLTIAQVQMGNSWRIGIDAENSTTLVSRGLFAVSRNPIFLGMRLNLLGLFLVLPTGITLVVLATSEVLIQVQVRLEEAHLAALHGEQYIQYKTHVRRWL